MKKCYTVIGQVDLNIRRNKMILFLASFVHIA